MPSIRNRQELEKVLSLLWDRILAAPEILTGLAEARIIVKFRYTDYPSVMYIDNTGQQPRYLWNPDPAPTADVEMILSSETSHRFWMQKLNVPMALATRKIIAKGSVPKALKLLPALQPAFALYPEVLRAVGREDLLAVEGPRRAKRRRRLFPRRKPKTPDFERLPAFPLPIGPMPATTKPPRQGVAPAAAPSDLLRTMHTIRAFEMHLAEAFRQGRLPTEAIHLSVGQEAVAAAVCSNLRPTDFLNTTHRGHGHIIAKGVDLKPMMAEIYGSASGLCGGKGGSMHVTDNSRGILGANGIVGAGYLLALGAGWSLKRQRRDDISVVIAGDGSVNQGMFHEALNMIALFELPVLIVVENNRYGEFTPLERHSAVTAVYQRAAAYGIEAERLDANDASLLCERIGATIAAIRADSRPRLVEVMTDRWHGHMEGDPQDYRSEKEKARLRAADPIRNLEKELLRQGLCSRDDLERTRASAAEAVEEAIAFAGDAPLPAAKELTTEVYAPEPASLAESAVDLPRQGELRQASLAQAVNEALGEEMQRDETVFLWGEDVTLGGYFNVTEGLAARFGSKRVVDTPISENAIVGGAVGAAMTGMRPVVEILFGDFLTCCMDPIVNQAAKLRYMTGGQVSIPLTIRTPVGGGIGMAAQHSQSMERFFFGVPGLIVLAAADAYTAKGLLKTAIRCNNPVLFFEHKLLYAESGQLPAGEYTLPLGKARTVRSGSDVTIVTHLLGVPVALEAAGFLEAEGISAEVIDLVCLYPLDSATVLASVGRTRHLVTLEEGPATGGIGAEVIARVAAAGFHLMKSAPLRLAASECPVPYAKNLENALLPRPEAVADSIAGWLP